MFPLRDGVDLLAVLGPDYVFWTDVTTRNAKLAYIREFRGARCKLGYGLHIEERASMGSPSMSLKKRFRQYERMRQWEAEMWKELGIDCQCGYTPVGQRSQCACQEGIGE